MAVGEPGESTRRETPGFSTLLARALKLRCPVCGRGRPFQGWTRVRSHCSECGYRFEREGGYFLGAMYFNYFFIGLLAVGSHFALELAFGLEFWAQLPILIPLCIVGPLWFTRYGRALWMSFDHLFAPPEAKDFVERQDDADRPAA